MNNVSVMDYKKYYSDNNFMYSATIELINMCNYRCVHCFINEKKCYGMKTSELFSVLNELREFGVYEIQFTGGEIFLREDIMDIIKHARLLYFKVALLTNASLLTEKIINELDELGVEVITTTLFSLNNEVNDSITKSSNSASKLLSVIELLKRTTMRIEVKTVVMEKNKNDYLEIERYCTDNGIEFLATEGLFPMFDGSVEPRNLAMEYNSLKNHIKSIDCIRFKSLYKEKKYDNSRICCELHYSLFIDSKGDIYPCNLWFKKIGNIRRSSISDIWNCEFLMKIRNLTWKDLEECSKCNKKDYCVRCTGIVEATTGSIYKKDIFSCRTAGLRKDIYEFNKGGE